METSLCSILVIESHPMMRAALCAAIADEAGLAVAAQASNCIEGLQIAVACPPDIVLLTLGRPGQDDLQSVAVLRKSMPGTFILALIRNGAEGLEQAALACGAQVVLSEAASRGEILQALRSMVAHV
jgi:DNA-binding NarL/FixJ family response regulator